MKNKAKYFLVGAGVLCGAVAAVTAISYAITNKLVEVALARDSVKSAEDQEKKKLQFAGSEQWQFGDLIAQGGRALAACECETVEIESHDGVRLVGHWRPVENPKRIVIAMHGWRSTWYNDFGAVAPFWYENGCSVLYAEQRGQGQSGGEYMGFGLIERYDCLEWAKWADKISEGKLPIYLSGVSMGATTVLMTAGLELPKSVHGITADSAYTSPHAIWKHVAENNLHLSYGVVGKMANDMFRKRINMGADEYSTLEALENCKVPIMLFHGTDDSFVPVEMTYENYKVCKAPKKLLIVPGADHGMSYFVETEKYLEIAKEFWRDFDNYDPYSSNNG